MPMRALESCPLVSTIQFDPCVHRDGNLKEHGRGATRILALRLPRLYSLLKTRNNGFCNHGKNVHLSLVGKNDDGTFKTSSKKTCPPS
eukprot:3623023-Pyramimonas_sp.AAC.1